MDPLAQIGRLPARSATMIGARTARYPAVIDIGSNTVRFVAFDGVPPGHLRVADDKVSCGLARDLGRTGRLAPEARALAFAAIERFLNDAARIGAATPALLATAAVREASDGAAFADAVRRRFGIPVRVLSGADEARLAALGVASGMPHAAGTVADFGGGSLELVELSRGRTGRSASLPLGHLRLFHQCGGAVESAELAIGRALAAVRWLPPTMRGRSLYVTGGSWRKIGRRHIAAAANAAVLDGYALVRDEAQAFAERTIAEIERRRAGARPGSPEARSTLAVAALVFARVLEQGAPATVIFSTRGVADGWLMAALADAAVPPAAP